nr:immunoglobulin light chain junction region [Macaca mulatta]MOW57238.1 immunoglobulin light chain junction region [Macaca mulatta]MOW57289.1 immunoglobulin light chain junction region [Macaca mulatta]MOW57307.1 immunoglobulin light chain junction region [Macaca mulatta]MOW57645.1 immunoglobulin light chain junction region [Macaca mulatta]
DYYCYSYTSGSTYIF